MVMGFLAFECDECGYFALFQCVSLSLSLCMFKVQLFGLKTIKSHDFFPVSCLLLDFIRLFNFSFTVKIRIA